MCAAAMRCSRHLTDCHAAKNRHCEWWARDQYARVSDMTESAGPGGPEGGSSRRADVPASKVVAYCLAIISVAAAVIHFAVAGSHFQEYWLFGVFMLAVAWLQLIWAVGVVARPSAWLLWAGAVINAGIIVIYILTRTVGDMVGPTPHDVEPFGFGDGLCTVLEAFIVAGCAFLLLSKKDFRLPREHLYGAPCSTAGAVVVLLSIALVAGGPEMVMSDAAGAPAATTSGSGHSGMHMTGTSSAHVASVSVPTGTPGG